MLKLVVEKDAVSGMVKGSLNEICADTAMIIHHVWNTIKTQDKESADEYASMVKRAVSDNVCFYDNAEDLAKKVDESLSEVKGKNKKRFYEDLDELVKQLEKIFKIEDDEGEDDDA